MKTRGARFTRQTVTERMVINRHAWSVSIRIGLTITAICLVTKNPLVSTVLYGCDKVL